MHGGGGGPPAWRSEHARTAPSVSSRSSANRESIQRAMNCLRGAVQGKRCQQPGVSTPVIPIHQAMLPEAAQLVKPKLLLRCTDVCAVLNTQGRSYLLFSVLMVKVAAR